MGDLVLIEGEVNRVMSKFAERRIEVTALHHHRNNLKPNVMFMHVGGQGDVGELAEALRAALEQSDTPLEQTGGSSGSEDLPLDVARLDEIVGHAGKRALASTTSRIPRAGDVTMDGMASPPGMGDRRRLCHDG